MPIYSTFGTDPFMSELVDMYVAEMPERTASLVQAFSGNDRRTLERGAHQLKGAAGSYGFETVTELAGALESSLRHDADEASVRQAFEALIEACEQVRAGSP